MNEAQLLGQLLGNSQPPVASAKATPKPTSIDPKTGLPLGVSSIPATSGPAAAAPVTTGSGAMSMGGANLLAMLSSADKNPPASSRKSANRSMPTTVADKGSHQAKQHTASSASLASTEASSKTLQSLRMQVYGTYGGVAAAPAEVSLKPFRPLTAEQMRDIGTKYLLRASAGKPSSNACEPGRQVNGVAAGPWDWPRKYLMWPHFVPILAVHHSGPVLTANSRASRRRQPKAAAPAPEPVQAPPARGRGASRRDTSSSSRDSGPGDWRSAPPPSSRVDYERTDDIENDQVGDLATLPAFFQPVTDEDDDGGLGGLEDDDGDDGGLESTWSPPPKAPKQAPLSAAAKKSERLRAKIESERLQQRAQWAEEEEEARLAAEAQDRALRAAGGVPEVPEHSPGLLGSKPPSPARQDSGIQAFESQAGGGTLLSQRIARAFGDDTPPPVASPAHTPAAPATSAVEQPTSTPEKHSASQLLARARMSQSPAGKQGQSAGSNALQTLFASAKITQPNGSSGGATALQMLQQRQQQMAQGAAQQHGQAPPPGSSAAPLAYRGALYTHAAVEPTLVHSSGLPTTTTMPQAPAAAPMHQMPPHAFPHGMHSANGGHTPSFMQGGYARGYGQPPMSFPGAQQQSHAAYMQHMQQQQQSAAGGAMPGLQASQSAAQAAYMQAMAMQRGGGMYTQHMQGNMQYAPQQQMPMGSSGASSAAPAWAVPATQATTAAASMQAQIQQQAADAQGTAQRQQAAATARAAAGQLLLEKAATLQAATSSGKPNGRGRKQGSAQPGTIHRMVPTTVMKRR